MASVPEPTFPRPTTPTLTSSILKHYPICRDGPQGSGRPARRPSFVSKIRSEQNAMIRPPEVAGHFRDDVETARAYGAGLQPVYNLSPWACGPPKCDENQSTDGPDNPKRQRGDGVRRNRPLADAWGYLAAQVTG